MFLIQKIYSGFSRHGAAQIDFFCFLRAIAFTQQPFLIPMDHDRSQASDARAVLQNLMIEIRPRAHIARLRRPGAYKTDIPFNDIDHLRQFIQT
ncbi:hypothetical protein AKJ29_14545 [Aliiroseovarius crassostreae]|uniref:Uncharacterized protein n=1 Tax=Aliiroseovarius crassostreae TaxID=154981 RepID=A0A0N8IBS2_9RHOB|nr:hypothetical protein AKJ29_14545 [Aliiroseovarius crassostreae]